MEKAASSIRFKWMVVIAFIFTISEIQFVYAQGCSDAGFCTLDAFKPNSPDSLSLDTSNLFKIGLSNGGADHSISVIGGYLEYSRQITSIVSLQGKLTFTSQGGNGIRSSGVSDLYIISSFELHHKTKLSLGIKTPFTDGNLKKNNLALPMDYQPSLGTVDLLFGISKEIKSLKLVFAYQQPVIQNKNQFLSENNDPNSLLYNFQSTNKYKRSPDVLLRISYPIKASEKFTITPSLLPIYHLSDDRFTDLDLVERKISGSKGLTFNANIYLDYLIKQNAILSLIVGTPFITRKTKPDGLTRSYVASLEYSVKF